MRKLSAIAFAVAFATAAPAFAQTETVSVDLSGISADLAAALGIDSDDLPTSIDLSADIAAQVCDVDVGTIGDSCVAVVSTDGLISAVESELDEDGNNSAREFAPGQQEGPARDAAPGQQDGDAKDFAPGQQKKAGEEPAGKGGNDTAPGQVKKSDR